MVLLMSCFFGPTSCELFKRVRCVFWIDHLGSCGFKQKISCSPLKMLSSTLSVVIPYDVHV